MTKVKYSPTKEDIEKVAKLKNTPKWLARYIMWAFKSDVEYAVNKILKEQEDFNRLHQAAHKYDSKLRR
ncbi:hypothetical protein LCGC14_1391580 [marine sediment metagenome]|uniref:Uncharacterized protein n=1 Tax=marine sediment metagenome TaxID=412755 RepID=A0A0F9K022_9ZZZZ